MPRLSDSMEEGTILQWLVAEGDAVEAGQPLVEVETDKATVTHEADSAGVVLALTVGEGASVPVGAPIAIVGAAGESLPEISAPEAIAAAQAREATSVVGASAPAAAAPATASGPAGASGPAAAPSGAGGAVSARPAPAPGLTPIPGRAKASPLARRVAAELGIDLGALAGSGPQGRVTRADVERAAAGANGGSVTATAATLEAPAPPTPGAGGVKGETTVHELTRVQRTVARRVAESRATIPDIELERQVDMGQAVALRERLREVADPVPSLNDFVVKAAALALREFPRVNGSYRDGAYETHSRVNVGIAVAAEDALVVPTIFDADRRSLREIGADARALASRVRAGEITPAELSGGTFTVSNLGMYGVDSFSAVINLPQVAILAVGALRLRPVVDETGSIVARPTIILTLACDHRMLYGADGARFLARVSESLERPLALLV
jgi:pyruvate dehydrogenase E2 component (dihydrolipoamide acetyltransferase)